MSIILYSDERERPVRKRTSRKVINHYGDEVMKVYDVAEAEDYR